MNLNLIINCQIWKQQSYLTLLKLNIFPPVYKWTYPTTLLTSSLPTLTLKPLWRTFLLILRIKFHILIFKYRMMKPTLSLRKSPKFFIKISKLPSRKSAISYTNRIIKFWSKFNHWRGNFRYRQSSKLKVQRLSVIPGASFRPQYFSREMISTTWTNLEKTLTTTKIK